MKQANIYTFPNQKIVTIDKTPCQDTLFAQYNMDVFLDAAQSLDAGAFKLWCYFAMNQNEYTFALSSKDARERFGLGKSQYDNAIGKLIKQGYLVNRRKDKKDDEQSNHWFFKDTPDTEVISNAPMLDSKTSTYSETKQGIAMKGAIEQRKLGEKELPPCIEVSQGLYENDTNARIETNRFLVENQMRNNINKINSIEIEYSAQTVSENEERRIQIGKTQTIPFDKKALADTELIEAITSVPNNYCLIKTLLDNDEIHDDLIEPYRKYLSDVDNGKIGRLFTVS